MSALNDMSLVEAFAIESPTLRRRLAAGRPRSALVVGRPTETNVRLAEAFAARGYDSVVRALDALPPAGADLVLARVDVLPTLDGVEGDVWALKRLERMGATLLNQPLALLSAHDKLATALLLGRAGVRQPRTAHVREPRAPRFAPPYVVKPRFGSWGRDVFRCDTAAELLACLDRLSHRRWFRRHGAIVQEFVETGGMDTRLVVAGGEVVGAIERLAMPGEWRTNVALGAVRRPLQPSTDANVTALRAAAAMGIDLAGIDMVVGPDGNHVVLEVNGAVDFTADYGFGGSDPFLAAVAALADSPIEIRPAAQGHDDFDRLPVRFLPWRPMPA
jgi:RimK family alpha-L-glutamate ligase